MEVDWEGSEGRRLLMLGLREAMNCINGRKGNFGSGVLCRVNISSWWKDACELGVRCPQGRDPTVDQPSNPGGCRICWGEAINMH